jgi:hypothetical protein
MPHKQEEVVAGYEGTQLENLLLQLIVEEQMEGLLDDNGFIFQMTDIHSSTGMSMDRMRASRDPMMGVRAV